MMSNKLPQIKPELTRCAVCKIDLKGKFVFIDEQIEQLLGESKENLFGKPLHDFLDDNSVALLDSILNVRNNYETFYDTTTLNFINKENNLFCLKVVVTLNFIAGNPVNFQLIIDLENVPTQSIQSNSVNEKEMLDIISELDSETLSDTNILIKFFHQLSKADSTAMYFVNENQLDLVATSEGSDVEDIIEKTLTETSQIHFDYAESGKIYSFLDDNDVSSAIEKYKEAPNEFLMPLIISDGVICLMRMNYSSDSKIMQLEKIFRQLLIASSVVEKMLSFQEDISEIADSVDIKFTIGFLESINIPAFLTNQDGDIVGYNPSMKRYFSEELLNGSYYNLFMSLVVYNRKSLINSISDYINSPFESSQATEKHFNLSLNKSVLKKMTILKIGDKETDRSACFVFVPK